MARLAAHKQLVARWRAIADIVIERLSEILHPKLLALLKGILSKALLHAAHRLRVRHLLLRLRLRHHVLTHVFVDVVDRAKNRARRRLLIDSPLVSLDQSQRLVALPFDARQRLIEVASEIINLRLELGDFGVPHHWANRRGDGVSKAGKDRHRISVSEEAQERRKELPDERYPHSAGQSRPLLYRLSQKNNPGATAFPY